MSYLALDLSKTSTGWALWNASAPRPVFGRWRLGNEFSSNGQVYMRLHRCLSDMFRVEQFERLYFEEPIDPRNLQGHTTYQTIELAFGLSGHAESFGAAKRCRTVKAINVERWRKDFIGDMVVREVKAGARRKRKAGDKANPTDQLKRLTMERCRQLGFNPSRHDEADAIGILTYAILLDGVTPPWIADEVLRAPLGGAA